LRSKRHRASRHDYPSQVPVAFANNSRYTEFIGLQGKTIRPLRRRHAQRQSLR
jgi:hypothetical protein